MTFGLIGFPLTHSFSKGYFTEKFQQLGLAKTHRYLNFELESFEGFEKILDEYPGVKGLNVTIPHKRNVLPYLDELDPVAARIGAVNCIRFDQAGKTTGFNTDYLGFQEDFIAELDKLDVTLSGFFTVSAKGMLEGQRALVFGTGGAALAVHEGLRGLGVETTAVSRTPGEGQITYGDISPELLAQNLILVNTTPLGMYPKVKGYPQLPYAALGKDHYCYDLVYNPVETTFLRKAREAGAAGANGMGMLERQAEAGWRIWNS